MGQIISKEELDELMKIKGEIRGDAIKSKTEFLIKETGEEGLEKLEDMIAKLGYPLKFKEIRKTDFYPLGLEAVILVLIKRLFNFSNEKFQEMGRFQSKFSLMVRISLKYFFTVEKMLKEVPKMWKKAFTVGDLKIIEFDIEKGRMVVNIEDFHFHPIYCQILIGFFEGIVQMIVKDEFRWEETKCTFRGDEYHQFLIRK